METLINNRYRVQTIIGQGGMGAVYRAYDHLMDNTIALKRVTIPKQDLDLVSRAPATLSHDRVLANEFSLLASLRHPNIISVRDYGFDDEGQPFFTMDLLANASPITHVAIDETLPKQIDYLLDILQALRYLHQRGILHRDLKPANILIADGILKVLDFGLAIDASISLDKSDMAGTLAYLAPEILQGTAPSPQSDLYSFGVVAHHVLSDTYPFPHDSQIDLIQRVMLEQPLPLGDHADKQLELVIARLLSKTPDDRYATAIDTMRAICDATNTPMPIESIEIRDSFLMASTFVGREEELASLKIALDKMLTGESQSILIGGESGIGKTRLMDEIRTLGLVNGCHVLRGQAITESNQKFKIWRDILPELVLSAEVSDEDASLLISLVPRIAQLLNRSIASTDLSDNELKVRLPIVLNDLLQSASAKRPLLILFEDLQWAEASIEILQAVLSTLGQSRVMIVANYRNDEISQLHTDLPNMQHMTLQRLSEENIKQLSTAMLGKEGGKAGVVDLIQRESEGNAFFIVEVMRTLAETSGDLATIGLTTLPAQVFAGGIQRVIERRLMQLPQWARHPLQVSSIIGRQIDSELLHHILPELDIEQWLLICSEIAILSVVSDDWQFTHDKLREAIIADLDDNKLQDIHHQVAEAIEIIYADELDRFATVLSDYYRVAGVLDKSATYAGIAGEYWRTFDPPTAYKYAKQAVEMKASQYHEHPVHEEARLQHLLGRTAMRISKYEESDDWLRQALEGFQIVGDKLGVARVKNNIGELGFKQWKLDGVVELIKESIDVLEEYDDLYELGSAYMHMSVALMRTGNREEAIPYFEKTVETMKVLGDDIEIAKAYNNLAIAKEMNGELDESVRLHQEALAIRKRLKDKNGLASSLVNLAYVSQANKDYDEAITLSLEALQYTRETNNRAYQIRILNTLAGFEEEVSNISNAINHASEARDIARTIGDQSAEANSILMLANLYAQSDTSQSKIYYLQAIRIMMAFDDYSIKIQAIEKYTQLLSQTHEISLVKQVEWLASILDYEGKYNRFQRVSERLEKLKSELPETDYTSAIEIGQQRSLNETLELMITRTGDAKYGT
ncbi:MAG: tetratricopeptide repeat protein [Chloroflexota bacterium]